LNDDPEDQGGAGGANDLNNLPGDRVAIDWFAYGAGVREDNFSAPGTNNRGANPIYYIGKALGGSPLFSLIEYFTTSTREEKTKQKISSLKRPRQMICYAVLVSGKIIHDKKVRLGQGGK
jgi:hypothetical protein